jgi:hypothetical protein
MSASAACWLVSQSFEASAPRLLHAARSSSWSTPARMSSTAGLGGAVRSPNQTASNRGSPVMLCAMDRQRRAVGAISGMVLIGIVAGCGGSGTSYASPVAAVAVACHAASVRGVYTYRQDPPKIQDINATPGRIQVGWQAPGQPDDIGWVALTEKNGGGYRVSNCKWKVNVEG